MLTFKSPTKNNTKYKITVNHFFFFLISASSANFTCPVAYGDSEKGVMADLWLSLFSYPKAVRPSSVQALGTSVCR